MKKNRGSFIGFCIYILLLLFQSLFESYIPIFKYFDELLVIIALLLFLRELLAKNKEKTELRKIILYFFGLSIIGTISSIIHRYQSFDIAFYDWIIMMKFPSAFIIGYLGFSPDFILNNNKKVLRFVKIIVVILSLLTILNYTVDLYPSVYRYGIKVNSLFYNYPTILAATCIFLLTLLLQTHKKIINIYSIALILITLSTLRIKAIGHILLFILLSFYLTISNKKITFSKSVILAIVIFTLAYNQIDYYFISNDESARKQLTVTSIQIAKDNFPIGSGFATYGSYMSSVSYSPVYYEYRLSNIYGLSKEFSGFISDTFWPMIIGQFGFAGLYLYLSFIILIIKKVQKDYNKEAKNKYISQIVSLSYLIISSTSEATFVNALSLPFAIVLGNSIKKKENIE